MKAFKFGLCAFAFLHLNSVNFAHSDDQPFITLASTSSTQNSGLFAHILPIYSNQSGIDVHVVAVGTGAAIKLAKRGDADVLLVHHTPSEVAFVKQGFGVTRMNLMYNDFVVIGPKSDPAQIRNSHDIADALQKISTSKAIFISRGDDSGTHKKERRLWAAFNLTPATGWYLETGSGMGATLNVASGMNAYTLTDRATWLSFANKGNLDLLFEGGEHLFNQYGVILVNKKIHPHIKENEGQNFIDWLVSDKGQAVIASFKMKGVQLFYPNFSP